MFEMRNTYYWFKYGLILYQRDRIMQGLIKTEALSLKDKSLILRTLTLLWCSVGLP